MNWWQVITLNTVGGLALFFMGRYHLVVLGIGSFFWGGGVLLPRWSCFKSPLIVLLVWMGTLRRADQPMPS
jgi:hypothetical protein